MKTVRNYLSGVFAAVKPLAIAAACALLIFSSATPALAFGGGDSKPSKGLEQLNSVQEKSEQAAASSAKSGANGTTSVMKDANEGLNGVQGAANKSDMISNDEASGTTIEGKIENVLEDIK